MPVRIATGEFAAALGTRRVGQRLQGDENSLLWLCSNPFQLLAGRSQDFDRVPQESRPARSCLATSSSGADSWADDLASS